MSRSTQRRVGALALFALLAAACSSDKGTTTATSTTKGADATAGTATTTGGTATTIAGTATTTAGTDVTSGTATTAATTGGTIDYKALGLWDDGPCDASRPPLVVGNVSPQDAPGLSLTDYVDALKAAATAFNARGGANGSCIQVVACDDKNDFDSAVACARTLEDAGVVATLNDSDTIAQEELSAAFAKAGIPRIGGNVAPSDWGDQNAYPIGAPSSVVFLLPDALLQQDIKDIGIVRVDLPAAAAAKGLFETIYGDDGAKFPADVPVPKGTTDYTQFILAAQQAGARGIILAVDEQAAVQVVRAAQQLGSDLQIGASLGSFSRANIADFGDTASKMIFVWSAPPATADVPVYQVLRQDLAASGETGMQPEHLKAGALMSWIGLYGLLWMVRDAGLTDFTREAITSLVKSANDVPMLGILGDTNWTPGTNYAGSFQRVGTDRWTYWRWDPNAEWNGDKGNFVFGGEISFSKTMCGSPFGAPGPC